MPFLGKTPTKLLDANVNIDGGNIDGTTIGASSTAPATVSTFTSTGIDDNATSTAITIDSSENVGIGTSSPDRVFHVSRSSASVVSGKFESASTSGSQIVFKDADTTTNDLQVRIGSDANDLVQYAGGSERMRIDSSGNVILNQNAGAADNTILRITGGTAGYSTLHLADTADVNIGFVQYDHTNNALTFASNNAERMRIDSSGNVGIGTTSPARILHVENDGLADLLLRDTSSYSVGTGPAVIFQGNDSGGTTTQFGAIYGISNGSNSGELKFETRNSGSSAERMRIDSSGNVGIGSPGKTLTALSDGTNSGPVLAIGNTDTALANNDTIGSITFLSDDSSYDGTYTDGIAAQISAVSEHSTGNRYGLSFYTGNASGSPTRGERLRIDSTGNVGIGTTSPSFISSSYEGLHVNSSTTGASIKLTNPTSGATGSDGFDINLDSSSIVTFINRETSGIQRWYTGGSERMRLDSSGNLLVGTTSFSAGTAGFKISAAGRLTESSTGATTSKVHRAFYNPNGQVGSITTSGSATAYNTSSDVRLKENIVDAPAGNIDAIRVRSFDWKADGSHQTYGMVAQELVDVAPEAVTQGETEDDMWAVDYSKLVPMMIKEIQDLKAEVAALKGA